MAGGCRAVQFDFRGRESGKKHFRPVPIGRLRNIFPVCDAGGDCFLDGVARAQKSIRLIFSKSGYFGKIGTCDQKRSVVIRRK
jgi:hypothetical protein